MIEKIERPTSALSASLAWVVALGALLALGGGLLYGTRAAASVATGAAIAAANLYVLGRIVASAVTGTSEASPTAVLWRSVGMLKFILVFFVVALLLMKHVVDPIPALVGLAALPLGVVLGALTVNHCD